MQIKTQIGSATSARPIPATTNLAKRGVIVAHCCNTKRAWGAGFVLAVNKDISKAPQMAYRAMGDGLADIPLGTTQFVETEPDLWVANMIAQKGIKKSHPGECLVDYASLKTCLDTTFKRAVLLECNVHISAGMGSGLAGGDKKIITDMIATVANSNGIETLQKKIQFVPSVILWEFNVTTASSYITPTSSAQPVGVSSDNIDNDGFCLDLDGVGS